jgi:hypothetical protein
MKNYKLLICINSIAAVLIVIGLILCAHLTGILFEQKSAERYGEGYVQLSLFYNADTGISLDTFRSNERTLVKKMAEKSLSETYKYAVSSLQTAVTITADDGKTSNVSAILTDGDYFTFHPYEILSGSYYGRETITPNVVILDEKAAWELFGAVNVAGKIVTIKGNVFEIYAVIKSPSDDFTKKTYGEKPRAYISMAAAEKVIPDYTTGTESINIIEYILPNTVKSEAMGILKETYAIDENTIDITAIENTNRFSPLRIIPKIPKITDLGVRDKPLVYPFYENAAVKIETTMAIYWFYILLFAVIPFASAIILVRRIIKMRKKIFEKAISGTKKLIRNIKIKQENRRKKS